MAIFLKTDSLFNKEFPPLTSPQGYHKCQLGLLFLPWRAPVRLLGAAAAAAAAVAVPVVGGAVEGQRRRHEAVSRRRAVSADGAVRRLGGGARGDVPSQSLLCQSGREPPAAVRARRVRRSMRAWAAVFGGVRADVGRSGSGGMERVRGHLRRVGPGVVGGQSGAGGGGGGPGRGSRYRRRWWRRRCRVLIRQYHGRRGSRIRLAGTCGPGNRQPGSESACQRRYR